MKKLLFITLVSLIVTSCSTKKNKFTSRTYHRVTSWYNTTFNGSETFKTVLSENEQSFVNNYFETLKVMPIDEEMLRSQYGGEQPMEITLEDKEDNTSGLDRVIAKAKKAIQNHSIVDKGKEQNIMLGEAYLLMGKAYYYKGDYFEAQNALNYMITNMKKSPRMNEAKAYLALAQSKAGASTEAEEIFKDLFGGKAKKKDKKLISKLYAQFLIDQKKYEESVEVLDLAKKYNKPEKARLAFIQGQLSQKLEKKDEAEAYFWEAYKRGTGRDIDLKAHMALASMFEGDSLQYKDYNSFLKKFSRKGLNLSKKNEVYYSQGLLAEKAKKGEIVEEYYLKALKEKESDPVVRGLEYQKLGEYYYDNSEYASSKKYLDSAVSKIDYKPVKDKIVKKAGELVFVADTDTKIKLNDSLLVLSKMPLEERKAIFEKHIQELKEKEEAEEKAIRDSLEQEGVFEDFTNGETNGSSNLFSGLEKGKWYFYNTTLLQTGIQDFRKIWGSRSLNDNWRYKKSTMTIIGGNNSSAKQEEPKDPQRFNLDYYLNQIPSDEVAIKGMKLERDTLELSLGVFFNDEMEDAKASTKTLEHLISTPPSNEDIKTKAYYNLYLANKGKNKELEDKYANVIVSNYRNTEYAENILNPQEEFTSTKSSEVEKLYEQAYDAYEKKQYAKVRSIANDALVKYGTDQMMAKFALLNAYVDAQQGNRISFMEGLDRVVLLFSGTPEGDKAQELLEYFETQETTETLKKQQEEVLTNQKAEELKRKKEEAKAKKK